MSSSTNVTSVRLEPGDAPCAVAQLCERVLRSTTAASLGQPGPLDNVVAGQVRADDGVQPRPGKVEGDGAVVAADLKDPPAGRLPDDGPAQRVRLLDVRPCLPGAAGQVVVGRRRGHAVGVAHRPPVGLEAVAQGRIQRMFDSETVHEVTDRSSRDRFRLDRGRAP